jgi:hypothetical protein
MSLGTVGYSQTAARSVVVRQRRIEILAKVIVLDEALRHMPLIG